MHWLLVRLLRRFPDEVDAAAVRARLDRQLGPAAVRTECRLPAGRPRVRATLRLGLAARARRGVRRGRRTRLPDGGPRWSRPSQPSASCTASWLDSAARPVREGTHANSAFALGLLLDAAESPRRHDELAGAIRERALGLVPRRPGRPCAVGTVRPRLPVPRAGRGRPRPPAAGRRPVHRVVAGVPARAAALAGPAQRTQRAGRRAGGPPLGPRPLPGGRVQRIAAALDDPARADHLRLCASAISTPAWSPSTTPITRCGTGWARSPSSRWIRHRLTGYCPDDRTTAVLGDHVTGRVHLGPGGRPGVAGPAPRPEPADRRPGR